jgi:hypothetical protein
VAITMPSERRLRAVPSRRKEDREREELTNVFRATWEHGVDGQARVIQGMQKILYAYTQLGEPTELRETIADIRWLIGQGVRDYQLMLDELLKLQDSLPADDADSDGGE